jgi:hypothetical protein
MDNVVKAPSFYINPHGVMPFICGIFLLLLGFFVASKNIKSKRNISWLLLSLTTALWTLFYSLAYFLNKETSLLIVLFKIGYTGIIFIPVVWLQFIIYFLDLEKQKKIIPFLYIIGFMFVFLLWGTNYFMTGLYKYYWGFYPKSNFYIHPLFLLFYSMQWIYGISLLFQKVIKEKSPLMKNRVKYVLLSLAAVFPGLGDFLGNYGIEFYPLGGAALVTICLILLTYSIYKYRLMDIRLAITRASIFILVYSFIFALPIWLGIKTQA